MLLTVKEAKREFQKCEVLSQDKNTEKVVKKLSQLVPAIEKDLRTFSEYMSRAMSIRQAEILLGRREADEEFKFICPKKLMSEQVEKELQDGGWFTGHWFRDMSTGEILVEVSYA